MCPVYFLYRAFALIVSALIPFASHPIVKKLWKLWVALRSRVPVLHAHHLENFVCLSGREFELRARFDDVFLQYFLVLSNLRLVYLFYRNGGTSGDQSRL